MSRGIGFSGSVAKAFIDSKLTPLLVLAALAMGIFAVVVTPREEEPQIQVPMIDVMVPYPGATAREVERDARTVHPRADHGDVERRHDTDSSSPTMR